MMPGGRMLILSVTFLSMCNAALAQGNQEHQQEIERARSLLSLLVDEKYEAFVAECGDEVKEALPPEKLKQAWTTIIHIFGPFAEELSATAMAAENLVKVVLDCRFESGNFKVLITLNKSRKVAGLLFLPSAEAVAYEPPPYVDTGQFHEVDVTVSAGEHPLPGTLTVPVGDGPFPGVVLVHGSGSIAGDRDGTLFGNKPYKDLAWGLATRGVCVLRYEKRTYKYPNLDPKTWTIDTETVDDALAAARLLMEHKEIEPKRVFVAGHSQGATAAPYIASKEPRIAGIIMLAAAARPVYEVGVDQTSRMATLDGMVDEAELALIEQAHQSVAALRDGTWRSDDDKDDLLAPYWATHNKLAPAATAKSLDIFILIVQGGRDFQICPEKDYVMWRQALVGRKNVTFKLFPNLDHVFHAGEGPSTLEQYREKAHVDAGLVAYLADWIRSAKPATGASHERE